MLAKNGISRARMKKNEKKFAHFKKSAYLCSRILQGYLSSVVEQWTENPRVPGSIPGGTTLCQKSLSSTFGTSFLID